MTDELIKVMAAAIADLSETYCKSFLEEARAALVAIQAAGYRVVPLEPTEAMATAMLDANIHPPHQWDGSVSVRAQNAHIYAAMIAAAPKVTE